MAWRVDLSGLARKNLAQMDPPAARRILNFLNERVSCLDDPRSIGETLKGSRLGEFWKYRVGDYRIICTVEDISVCILVIRIGNRREVYKRK